MSEAPTKDAVCVAEGCGKAIKIGKFASAKTAYCDDHASLRTKPTPPAPKKKDPPVDKTAIPGNPQPIAESPIPGQAAPAASPNTSPEAGKVFPLPPAPVSGQAAASEVVADPKTPKELKEAFLAIVGQKLPKDKQKLTAIGFDVTQHGIVHRRFADNRVISMIELKGVCIGVGVTMNGATEGYFDISTIHNLRPDERKAVTSFSALVA